MNYYRFRYYGSRRGNFTKYLKKLFPEHVIIKYDITKVSDEDINKEWSWFRLYQYNDRKRYSAEKVRECLKNCFAWDMFVPQQSDNSSNLFTLLKIKYGQSNGLFSTSDSLDKFFDSIHDVQVRDVKLKKYYNVDLWVDDTYIHGLSSWLTTVYIRKYAEIEYSDPDFEVIWKRDFAEACREQDAENQRRKVLQGK